MNKTLPENMADFLIQCFANTPAIVQGLKEKKEIVTTNLHDNSKSVTMLSRGLEIWIGPTMFSLAIDIPKEFYRPYKDSELDACITYNLHSFLNDPEQTFMTCEQQLQFVDDCNAVFDEAWK